MTMPTGPTDRAWIDRQATLGPLYMQLWLSPWSAKRQLLQQYPDLADPHRRMFARVMVRKALDGKDPAAAAQFDELVMRDEPLLDRCAQALALAASTGVDLADAIARVFADPELAAQYGETPEATAAPAELETAGVLPPAVEVIITLAQHGQLDAAIERAQEHIAAQEAEHGHASLYAADAHILLAKVCTQERGHEALAQVAYDRGIAIRQARVGELHPLTLSSQFALLGWLAHVSPQEAIDTAAPLLEQLEDQFARTGELDHGLASCRALECLAMAHAFARDPAASLRAFAACLERLDANAVAWSATFDVASYRAQVADELAAVHEKYGQVTG
jgi:hypothetical protein